MTDVPEETLVDEPRLASWRTVVRSFGTLAVGEGIARVGGLVALIVMARVLEPYGFGLIVLGTMLVNWFFIVADSGTELIAMRDVSRRPERFRSIAGQVLGLRLALSVIAMGLFAVAVIAIGGDGFKREVLLTFALVLPALALNLRWIVLGVDGSRSVAAGNIASQLLFVAGILLLVTERHDATTVPLIRTASELLYAVVVLGLVARRFGLSLPRVDLAAWRSTLAESMPLMANNLARAVIYSFGTLVIAAFLGSREVGFYGAAYKPVLFLTGLMALFSAALLSSYSAARTNERRHELAARTIRVAAAASLSIAGVATVASPVAVPLVFGQAYEPAIAAFAILAWTIPLMALTTPYSTALIAAHRQRILLRHNLAGAGFNIAAALVAVPLFGIEGAATVTVASFALVLALNQRSSVALGLAPAVAPALRRRRRLAPLPGRGSAPPVER